MLREALRSVDADDDAVWAAGVMLRFFLEEAVVDNEAVGSGEALLMYEEDVMARL